MRYYLLVSFLSVMGCQCPLQEKNRDKDYDQALPPIRYERPEPYGEYAGHTRNGEKLYLIHWKGNPLNLTGLPESEIDKKGLPKYDD